MGSRYQLEPHAFKEKCFVRPPMVEISLQKYNATYIEHCSVISLFKCLYHFVSLYPSFSWSSRVYDDGSVLLEHTGLEARSCRKTSKIAFGPKGRPSTKDAIPCRWVVQKEVPKQNGWSCSWATSQHQHPTRISCPSAPLNCSTSLWTCEPLICWSPLVKVGQGMDTKALQACTMALRKIGVPLAEQVTKWPIMLDWSVWKNARTMEETGLPPTWDHMTTKSAAFRWCKGRFQYGSDRVACPQEHSGLQHERWEFDGIFRLDLLCTSYNISQTSEDVWPHSTSSSQSLVDKNVCKRAATFLLFRRFGDAFQKEVLLLEIICFMITSEHFTHWDIMNAFCRCHGNLQQRYFWNCCHWSGRIWAKILVHKESYVWKTRWSFMKIEDISFCDFQKKHVTRKMSFVKLGLQISPMFRIPKIERVIPQSQVGGPILGERSVLFLMPAANSRRHGT